jgi:ACS family hexuronate transporter-like MFS transporter
VAIRKHPAGFHPHLHGDVRSWMSATVFAIFSDLFPDNAVGRVTGLTGVGNGASSMILNFATGFVVDRFSYVPVFAMAGLLPALGMAVLFLLAGRIERVKIKTSDASS